MSIVANVEPNTSTKENGSLVDRVKAAIEKRSEYQFGDKRIMGKALTAVFVTFLNGLASVFNKPIREEAKRLGKKPSEMSNPSLIGNYDVIKAIFNKTDSESLQLKIPRENLRRFGNQVKSLLDYDTYVDDDDYHEIVNFMAADMASRPNNVKFTLESLQEINTEEAADEALRAVGAASAI